MLNENANISVGKYSQLIKYIIEKPAPSPISIKPMHIVIIHPVFKNISPVPEIRTIDNHTDKTFLLDRYLPKAMYINFPVIPAMATRQLFKYIFPPKCLRLKLSKK